MKRVFGTVLLLHPRVEATYTVLCNNIAVWKRVEELRRRLTLSRQREQSWSLCQDVYRLVLIVLFEEWKKITGNVVLTQH